MWEQWSEDMRYRYNKHTEQTEHLEYTPQKNKLPSQNPNVTSISTPTRAHTGAQIDVINPLSLTPRSLSGTSTVCQIADDSINRSPHDSVLNSGDSGSKIRTDGSTGAKFKSVTSSPACATTASTSSSSSSESTVADGTPHKDKEMMDHVHHEMLIDNHLTHSDVLDTSIVTLTPDTTPLRGTGRSSSDIGGWGEVHLVADHSDEDEGPVFITNPMGERKKKSTESTVSADTAKFDDEKPFFMDNPLLSAPNSRRHSISDTPPQELEIDQINETHSKRGETTDKKSKKKGKKTAST